MKLHFDPNQPHQLDAINSIVGIFEGQPLNQGDFSFLVRHKSCSSFLNTVIANESYEDFAKQLQTEIEEDCGVSFAGRIKNNQDKKTVKYRKGFELEFNKSGIIAEPLADFVVRSVLRKFYKKKLGNKTDIRQKVIIWKEAR